jgi:hypothetical protein
MSEPRPVEAARLLDLEGPLITMPAPWAGLPDANRVDGAAPAGG